jgi:hypothetical protein
MAKVDISMVGEVVEFYFARTDRELFNDEGQPGLETCRDAETGQLLGYMTLNMVTLYNHIMRGLETQPVPGRYTVTRVEDLDKVVLVHDPAVTDVPFAEVVHWVYETYFAPALTRESSLAPAVVHEPGPDYVTGEEQNQGTRDNGPESRISNEEVV